MAIFDCFQFFNEEHVADLRFNILNDFVDYFVIVESTVNHQGKEKKLQFDINILFYICLKKFMFSQ